MSTNFGVGGYGPVGPYAAYTNYQNPAAKCGSVLTSFKEKYGCEDCFRRQPHWLESTVRVQPVPVETVRPSFWRSIRQRILGC